MTMFLENAGHHRFIKELMESGFSRADAEAAWDRGDLDRSRIAMPTPPACDSDSILDDDVEFQFPSLEDPNDY